MNRSDPRNVVDAVFQAARSGHPAFLEDLCDPLPPTQIDVRRICDYAAGFDPEGEFPMFFANGRLVGSVLEQGDQAWVPFYFGPNGDRLDTMELVKREGKWYLERF